MQPAQTWRRKFFEKSGFSVCKLSMVCYNDNRMNTETLHNLNPKRQDADSLRRKVSGAILVAYTSPRLSFEGEV